MIGFLVAGVAVVAGGVGWGRLRARRLTAAASARRSVGPDGVVIGGEGFVLERAGAPAILLIHGAGDTPQTLRYLAEELHTRGFHVAAPLLPAHGRSVGDFSRISTSGLVDATVGAYRELRAAHDWVGVIGLSMGGALAVLLAAETPDLPALGLAAPYLAMPPRIARAARLSWLWGIFAPVVASSDGISILDANEQARNLAYGVFTPAALRALYALVRRAQAALPHVAAPTLLVQSRRDNRIAVASAEWAFAKLGAREKRLEWVTGAAHIITVDYGREHVFALFGSWMERHVAVRAPLS